MADKISKKNIAENSTEVNLKTPSDFQSPSSRQELQSSNEFDGNTISACFSNILEKFTIKQANIMGSFAEVLTNNQTKNINKISDEIGKKLQTLNNSLTAYNKTKSSTGHSVRWGINPASKTPPSSFSPSPLLNLQTVQAPLFRQSPPSILVFLLTSPPPKNQIFQ